MLNNSENNVVKKNVKINIIFEIFVFVIALFGGTYAIYKWVNPEEQRTDVMFSFNENYECSADGGGNLTEGEKVLVPTNCMNSEFAIKREIKVNVDSIDGLNIAMSLWLDINEIGEGLSNSQNFRYALTTSDSSCTEGVVSQGNFNTKVVGDKINLLKNKVFYGDSNDTYYLYVWIDEAQKDTSTANQKFNLSLNGSCEAVVIVNKPILDDGMVPIVISDNGIITTISKDDSNWYDYDEKKWANIVLVNENATSGIEGSKSREYYLNNPGTPVLESDILAYYVWIPRYKYRIWTLEESSMGNESEIDIVFEEKNEEISTGSKINDYITHPAFIFGDKVLPGMWVGKFETTGSITEPTVLPNNIALINYTIGEFFTSSLKFAGGTKNGTTGEVIFSGNSIYGLTSRADSHMMKNSEWGVAAYLSHSRYGINEEIYVNNSSGYYTGRSGGNVGGSVKTVANQYSGESSTYEYNAYGYYTWIGQVVSTSGVIGAFVQDLTLGTKASSTGNLTGIYDMSGGAFEYMMGVFQNASGDGAGLGKYPASKYIDIYSNSIFVGDSSSNLGLCTVESCGGHGLNETSNWYGDYNYFVNTSAPWFVRGGGYYGAGEPAGVFAAGYNTGRRVSSYGYRSVIVVDDIVVSDIVE